MNTSRMLVYGTMQILATIGAVHAAFSLWQWMTRTDPYLMAHNSDMAPALIFLLMVGYLAFTLMNIGSMFQSSRIGVAEDRRRI